MKFLNKFNPSTRMKIIMTTKVQQEMNFRNPKQYNKVLEDMRNLNQFNIVLQENTKFLTKHLSRMKTQ